MPTDKPRKAIVFEEDELFRLGKLYAELQSPGRKGTDLYVSPKVKFNQFVNRCTMERAEQIEKELGLNHRRKR